MTVSESRLEAVNVNESVRQSELNARIAVELAWVAKLSGFSGVLHPELNS
ncbi:MAG: hypothetical protein ACRC4N_14930 [Gammaproteobacteria bacterium]